MILLDEGFLLIRVGRDRPVVDPYERPVEKLPSSRVLLLFHPRLYSIAMRMIDERRKATISGLLYKAFTGIYMDRRILVVLPFWGAPAAVAGLEVLIAGGGEVFISVGRAGSINPRLRIGDVLIPLWGVREEGTSYHYMPPNYIPRPDSGLAGKLYDEIMWVRARRRIRILKGGIWTMDALFRETRDKIAEYAERRVLGVDLEATGLMTVAKYRGVPLAIADAVSDELYTGEWKPGFDSYPLHRTERVLVEAALRTLVKHGA